MENEFPGDRSVHPDQDETSSEEQNFVTIGNVKAKDEGDGTPEEGPADLLTYVPPQPSTF